MRTRTPTPRAQRAGRADVERRHIDVVVIAASAGGLKALSVILAALPASFPAAVVIVQHVDPRHPSYLAEILSRRTALRVRQAHDGDRIEPGVVYVAPPDHHLLVTAGRRLALTQSELVRFVRPSADLLFASVAASFGERALAVVLTGSGKDGADGVSAVKRHGGLAVAQDERTAEFAGMPAAAIATGDVDLVLPLEEIGALLASLAKEPD